MGMMPPGMMPPGVSQHTVTIASLMCCCCYPVSYVAGGALECNAFLGMLAQR